MTNRDLLHILMELDLDAEIIFDKKWEEEDEDDLVVIEGAVQIDPPEDEEEGYPIIVLTTALIEAPDISLN